jgi:predicted PhzF superfamily epimerase YddE/YHI9
MRKAMLSAAVIAAAFANGALAADMLPLKRGIYVPVEEPCKGASNAAMRSYWGAKSAFNDSWTACTIVKMTRNGNVYTITDKCAITRGGSGESVGETVVTIASPTRFVLKGETYRYCGSKVQF